MNRNDWVLVGMRLYGLYLLVEGVLSLPGVFAGAAMPTELRWHNVGVMLVIRVGLAGLIGAGLFLGAPSILRWLDRKDARAELA